MRWRLGLRQRLPCLDAHIESNGLGAFEDKHLARVVRMCGLRLKVRSVETTLSLQSGETPRSGSLTLMYHGCAGLVSRSLVGADTRSM